MATSCFTRLAAAAVLISSISTASAQTFRRLGACPTLGCIFPPDQTDFLAGQYFDIRAEVHAPVNGSEASHNGVPDPGFVLTIKKNGDDAIHVTNYFNLTEPKPETWSFEYYEDLFAQDAGTPVVVNVAAKAWRRIALYEPGYYTVTLAYYSGEVTIAKWYVRDLSDVRKTKNVILFIGDGMTTNMITAARLIGHKQVNGRYQTSLSMDKFPNLGHQMSHSIDSFITDSANSATALYTGHKSTVNALGVYVDSSPDPFDDPKVESVAELFQRLHGGHIGIVTTAYLADATPSAFYSKTSDRSQYAQIIDNYLYGATKNGTWIDHIPADVIFGGGAENFENFSGGSFNNQSYYDLFSEAGYNVVNNLAELKATPNAKTLGVFTQSNLPVWLDRNVYTDNLADFENDPLGGDDPALNIPGLKEMTLKAIDILQETSDDKGWFIMSEAASIDKQMHALDYDRALGDLLELDNTVRATIDHLTALGVMHETLILVTADHGHGFDVMGSVDTEYLAAQSGDREKRNAVGTYKLAGESQYVVVNRSKSDVNPLLYTEGSYFPAQWDPRYTLFAGIGADPDRRENYKVHADGPRTPAVELVEDSGDYYVNPEDAVDGFVVNGTLPVSDPTGVHSLTDVPVYAYGPCESLFSGTYNSIDIFFGISECLGLSRFDETTADNGKYTLDVPPRGDVRHVWRGDGNGEGWWSESDHWGF